MEGENQTTVAEFVFLALTLQPRQEALLFLFLFLVYLATMGGNLGMTLLLRFEPRLHTPMYLFLSHLSFGDACPSSPVAPKTLRDIFAETKSISFVGCAAQMWVFGLFVATECFLLAAMACDRYSAVCKPLLYTLVMSQRVRVRLVLGPYAIALVSTMTHTTFTFSLPFCGPNIINHFFCDISPLLSLACVDTWVNKSVLFVLAGVIGAVSGLIIMASYACILGAIVKIQNARRRWKAVSTCSSHLAAVSILYGTLIYVRPGSSSSLGTNKGISLFYTVVIPMLNPIIYSLRNTEVEDAFWRRVQRKQFLRGG
ncbi:LOW QUALITY PROTEIN: olfactory receptor 5G3-like [Ctenodactylus gundi]